jgi:radical SAM superfamily enzyme YgiQ (UPF0313 family)
MKIGLLAISGIRACDQELLRLGLTLPGFVERSRTIASLPSLGLLTLAGMTPAHHQLRYCEVPDPADWQVQPDAFDLVAISSYSAQINEAYELADRYRQAGVTVVMGGPHVTALPEEALTHCDVAVVGEGEACWQVLLEDAENGTLARIYASADDDFSMADAPMPAFEMLDVPRYNRLTVQTSRSCPHRCEFCAASVMLTQRYKQKPISKVLAEIDRICTIWQHPFIEFADDNTFVDKTYWKDLLPELAARRVKWFAETDLSVWRDEPLLALMRQSGCAQLLIGLESPVATGLAGLDLRGDWKFKHFSEYAEAIATIQRHGITVNGCFVIGLDGHTPAIFDDLFEFVRASGLYEVQVTILTPFPGTPLYDRLQSEDRLLDPTAWQRCTLFDVNYRPRGMTIEQLTDGFRRLVVRLYGDEFTRYRRDNFKKLLAQTRTRKGDPQ